MDLHDAPLPDSPLRGTAWVAREYVFAYDIITQPHWTDPVDKTDNARWVMQGVSDEFEGDGAFAARGYSFVVAGHNFAGGGKSIEHVVAGLMGAGIQAVLADSHSRLQFRNAINYGLPFVTCRGINEVVETGDELEVDLAGGRVTNLRTGESRDCAPVPPFVAEISQAGGLVPYIQRVIAEGRVGELR